MLLTEPASARAAYGAPKLRKMRAYAGRNSEAHCAALARTKHPGHLIAEHVVANAQPRAAGLFGWRAIGAAELSD